MHFRCTVDVTRFEGTNDRFWAAAGTDALYPLIFTESGDALLSRMQRHGTCRYLRCHYTLSEHACDGYDDCGGNVYTEDAGGNPVYHFEKMRAVFARYLKYGVRPIVELDFMPAALGRAETVVSENGEQIQKYRTWPNDWERWAELLRAFVRDLAETFGAEELRQWYFEVWNEPDNWPVEDWPQFYRMYDIFADAVKSVDSNLRIGGAGAFTPAFMRGFLEHLAAGKNAVTGKIGAPADFLSYHIYGMSGGWLEQWPLVLPTVQRFTQELLWLQRMIEKYPSLTQLPILVDEWGVVSNYEKTEAEYPPLALRNSEYSALFLVKLADAVQHLRRDFGMPIEMLLYWGFCMEDERGIPFAGNRDLMTAPHLPKPILTAYELLAKPDENVPAVTVTEAGANCGVLTGASEGRVQVLLYHFNELDLDAEMPALEAAVTVEGLAPGAYRLRETVLDRSHHNTYRLWKAGASEDAVRAAAALTPDGERIADCGGALTLSRTLPAHSMVLLELERV